MENAVLLPPPLLPKSPLSKLICPAPNPVPTYHHRQAIALLIDLAEDLCLGGSHSGDIVPEIIGDAFDAFRDAPANIEAAPSPAAGMTTAAAASALVDNHVTGAEDNIPVFRRLSDMPLASLRNSQSAFGGAEKLARFLLPLVSSRGATRHCSDQ